MSGQVASTAQIDVSSRIPRNPRPPIAPVTPAALSPFFRLASGAPSLAAALVPLARRLTPLLSRSVRDHTRLNARRLTGQVLARAEQSAFTRDVVGSFCEFIIDIGRSSRVSVQDLQRRIDSIEGKDGYLAERSRGRGAVLITIHMGSFEVGLAALAQVESRIHVVYKRDTTAVFETIRGRLRQRLGVREAPIDEGLATWIALRDALRAGDVIVMQADRAMPGQRSVLVPLSHGHVRLPTGPVRLARLTGCPIIPVFTIRSAPARFVVHLLPAIEPGTGAAEPDEGDPTVLAVARAIESMIVRHPTQWLMLGPAFEEDQPRA